LAPLKAEPAPSYPSRDGLNMADGARRPAVDTAGLDAGD
jgi:hypothetical protein